MSPYHKIFIIEDMKAEKGLSMILAQLGLASMTAPVEALDDSLSLAAQSSAIVLRLPKILSREQHQSFTQMLDKLSHHCKKTGTPLILVTDDKQDIRHQGRKVVKVEELELSLFRVLREATGTRH